MDDFTPHDGETDPFKLAEQERWLDLARLGKIAWNTWAEVELEKPSNKRMSVDLSDQDISNPDFRSFQFPGIINFENSRFGSQADFTAARFSGDSNFHGVKFSHGARFFKSIFEKESNFYGAIFQIESSFTDSVFHSHSDFSRSQFWENAIFSKVIFDNNVIFSNSKFEASADFSEVTFSIDADFDAVAVTKLWRLDGASISGSFSAQSAEILGHAYFTDSRFHVPPDLITTAFSRPPSFVGSTFKYPCINQLVGKCSVQDGEARFRRLKQLAADNHDHEVELRLFAFETKAKRFHTLKLADPRHWPGLVLNFAYGWTSNFGQSVLRPLGWLLLTVGAAFVAFCFAAPAATSLWVSAVAAGLNVFPFGGQAGIGREIMTKGLCPMQETDVGYLDCLTTLYTVSAVEGVFGLIFLFLIGLGLRNRFRIK